MRTAKSCGSDAPGLASSLREEAQATVTTKPGHRGEREVSRKTIARGMPGDFRCDRGDYARVLFYFAREAAGAFLANLARNVQRDREAVSGVIARSEATKQSKLSCGSMDCFAEPVIGRRFAPTRWLAMTLSGCLKFECVAMGRNAPHSSRHHPRKRVIQYSEAPMMKSKSRGVLDTPLSRSMTAICETAKRSTPNSTPACCRGCRARMSERRSRTARRSRSPSGSGRS